MRIFGFSIITAKAMDAVHRRHRLVMAELEDLKNDMNTKSMQRRIIILEDQVEALKEKCSRVNVSALENEIRRLENEKMSGYALRDEDPPTKRLLPRPLVRAAGAVAEGDMGDDTDEGERLAEMGHDA